ncbi:MAG: stage III sporulation protein AF [Sporomusaceae bacterium]|nr:stage III sporulation protein AF [Sporomusaceae bacterium]
MIEAIVSWVMGIIFTALFASFSELLLPSSNMQKFVRVIMGLFIMLAILNPVMAFFERAPDQHDIAAMAPRLPDAAAVEQAAQAAGRREKLINTVYRQDLAKQMQALVIGIDGVAAANVTVELVDDQAGLPQIKAVAVSIRYGTESKTVQPVVIGKKTPAVLPAPVESNVRKRLSELYQLPLRQITVTAM